MKTRGPRYSKDEFARRGKEWYRTVIRPKLGSALKGKHVAIDIETGEYEIADELGAACDALYARLPDAQPWGELIGYQGVISFTGAPREDPEWLPES